MDSGVKGHRKDGGDPQARCTGIRRGRDSRMADLHEAAAAVFTVVTRRELGVGLAEGTERRQPHASRSSGQLIDA